MITNNNNPQPQPDNQSNQKSNRRPIIIGAVSAGLLLIVAGWLVYSSQKALHQLQNEKDQMQLDYEQQQLAQDAEDLDREFAVFENSRQLIMDDSVKRDLTEKYENARMQVEALQAELKFLLIHSSRRQ